MWVFGNGNSHIIAKTYVSQLFKLAWLHFVCEQVAMCWFRQQHFCRHMEIVVDVVKEIVKMLQRKVKYVQRTISLLVRSIFFFFLAFYEYIYIFEAILE